MMILHLQHFYPGLYAAPRRWPTRDGCLPYHLVLVYWRAMLSGYAFAGLHHARAAQLSRADQAAWERATRDALGEEA